MTRYWVAALNSSLTWFLMAVRKVKVAQNVSNLICCVMKGVNRLLGPINNVSYKLCSTSAVAAAGLDKAISSNFFLFTMIFPPLPGIVVKHDPYIPEAVIP